MRGGGSSSLAPAARSPGNLLLLWKEEEGDLVAGSPHHGLPEHVRLHGLG